MKILWGDCRETLLTLDASSVQCCITSPPYWGLRDYGTGADQLGLDPLHDCLGWARGQLCGSCYVCHIVDCMRAVRSVLREDGTLWLNLGDSYSTQKGEGKVPGGGRQGNRWKRINQPDFWQPNRAKVDGLKPKDLAGIPWRCALALQADGWYLRSDIIWSKPNKMPESVKDRPTLSHEYLFLFSQEQRYYYDHEAIKEEGVSHVYDKRYLGSTRDREGEDWMLNGPVSGPHRGFKHNDSHQGRNRRSVWTLNTTPYHGAHFAVFPPSLVSLCIQAGSRPGDTVLDPFLGSGTVGMVANDLGREWIGCEINREYEPLIERRTAQSSLGL